MTVRCSQIELFLIAAALLAGFLYFALRAMAFDVAVWILIVPILSGIYLLIVIPRYSSLRLNALDWIVLLYLLYGTFMATVAVLFLDANKVQIARVFSHYYFPVIIYFLARRYTHRSVGGVMNITKLVWILAVVFVIDVLVEFYFVEVRETGLSIPWVREEVAQHPTQSAELAHRYNSERVLTVLTGAKKPGLAAAAFFVIILPLLYSNRPDRTSRYHGSIQFRPLLNAAILAALLFAAFELQNKTAILAASLALGVGLLSLRSPRRITMMSVLLGVALLFTYSSFANIVRVQFLTPVDIKGFGTDTTIFAYTFDSQRVVDSYLDADPYSFFFGAHIAGNDDASISGSSPTGSKSFSELRGLVFPIYFGFGWALIALACLVMMIRYSARLTRDSRFRFFGMACLGLVLVYFSDLHYPSGMFHGPFELFLVMAGTLSSLNEIVRAPDEVRVKTGGWVAVAETR